MRISYKRGQTYVAVGFVDLSQLLLGEFPDIDVKGDPITFVGIDCGADQGGQVAVLLFSPSKVV